jgi:hypothetical protein
MKKFLMFITGFVTALALSLVIIHRLIRFTVDILFRLDALDALKEGFLIYLGKAMGLREFEFKPRRRFRVGDYSYAYGRGRRMSEEENNNER